MYKQKTTETDADALAFIEEIEPRAKREDAYRLLEMFERVSGYPPKMWGPSIIGFGSYHYVYATGHEGDAPIVGFSPRKTKHSLYFTTDEDTRNELLAKLGKYTSGKSCVYINKLPDVDEVVLEQLIAETKVYIEELYPGNGEQV